jgi:hypothetical protein
MEQRQSVLEFRAPIETNVVDDGVGEANAHERPFGFPCGSDFLCDAHGVERNLSCFDETGAVEQGGGDLAMTTGGAKELAELAELAVFATEVAAFDQS